MGAGSFPLARRLGHLLNRLNSWGRMLTFDQPATISPIASSHPLTSPSGSR